ncbi:hypothetical protein [Flavobacterium sp.]|jgi:hypothetical protein|uniref:hypothetical protein n=1 Tax=Flavobacterium sp. TaxID=239 RepID=UPI0037C0B8A9
MNKLFTSVVAVFAVVTIGQSQNLPNWRPYDKTGINVFEAPKDTATTFTNVRVKVGGAFALQYQALDHENTAVERLNTSTPPVNLNQLIEIGNNFNLPTANLDLDVELYDGVNMHLRTYLSSRHHPEPYVKGGYIQIDKLEFISKGFMADAMQYLTLKIGQMENNYGDTHFRRTDNALALYNPFVESFLMDSFTTEVGAELYFQKKGFMAMLGATNGKLNQGVNNPGTTSPSTLVKLGYDKQLNEDLRTRITGSVYHTAQSARTYLYAGDRAGSRYYFVMENTLATATSPFASGRIDPAMRNEMTAIMINPFVKYNGLEFFGVFETTSGKNNNEVDRRNYTQIGAELLYRFGKTEQFYFGGRYNTVSGETPSTGTTTLVKGDDIDVSRYNVAAGWFMTKNILAKLEYVNQKYDGYSATNILNGGAFNGFIFEATISF